MKKIERNYYGWDITVVGKKFNDRFQVRCVPNMNYIYQLIQNELYPYLATKYAEQNNLSTELERDIDIIRKWTDNSIQEFIEDISTMEINFHRDFPFSLFCSLEERINEVMKYVKKDMKDTTPLSYYKVLQDDERFDYRIKI